jgi:hypothetical protein
LKGECPIDFRPDTKLLTNPNGLLGLLKNDNSFVRSRAAASLGQLAKKSIDDVLPALTQWIEQQPEDVPIGDAIDVLWSIVVE